MMQVLVLGLYILLLMVIGWFSSRKIKNESDFYVAGEQGSAWKVSGSLIATVLGSSAIIGTMELSQKQSWAAAWLLLCGVIGLAALYPLAGRVKRLGKFTLPQLLSDFYGDTAGRIAGMMIGLAWMGIIAAQIMGAAKILSAWMDWPVLHTMYGSTLVITVYTILGGQWSVIKTDFWQSIIILMALYLTGYFLMSVEGAVPLPKLTDHFPFEVNFQPVDLLLLLLTYASTFLVGPDIYSRIFCAKDEFSAKRAVLISVVIILPLAFLVPYLGMKAMTIYPDEVDVFHAFVGVVQNHLPGFLGILMILALLSAVISSADTTLLSAALILGQVIKPKVALPVKQSRIWMVVLAILSFGLAWKMQSVIGSLLLGLSIYSGAFILPMALGLMGYRGKPLFVHLAMVFGGVVAGIGKFIANSQPELSALFIFAAFGLNLLFLFVGFEKWEKLR
ncbi:sodium:solute symporter family protein [Persicobacter diffluens]|uniref:Sodium:solute symporter n=1 Tax=Persicobacter diffluens TaxID=981 RepID=A0AAN5ALD2_9BACT|nr:hypothetical protein PEDI_18830 [Persicobacter diffluens]